MLKYVSFCLKIILLKNTYKKFFYGAINDASINMQSKVVFLQLTANF